MKMKTTLVAFIAFALTNVYATEPDNNKKTYTAQITTMTDAQYPDNNSIGFRSALVGTYSHSTIQFTEKENGLFQITISPENNMSDTITLNDINLLEMMPSFPEYLRSDNYLSHLAVFNQEWNRIQVRFNNQYYSCKGNGSEKEIISRVDIANNCLSAGEWELILFTKENGNEVLYFQSWFEFPKELYSHLFKRRNGVEISPYYSTLKEYHKEKSKQINLKTVRTVEYEKETTFANNNDALYPLKGERQTKAKNIISPVAYTTINDFLNDDAKFATFASPGMYTRLDPRVTQLSHFQKLNKVLYCSTFSLNKAGTKGIELQLQFSTNDGSKVTNFIIGGLELDKIPTLKMDDAHKGFQKPMGFSNHSFYNDYQKIIEQSSLDNAYFAILTDEKGMWLDSHEIGIDGPLFFVDADDPTKLHLLILSFERHAFVGHFVIDIPTI